MDEKNALNTATRKIPIKYNKPRFAELPPHIPVTDIDEDEEQFSEYMKVINCNELLL